MSAEVGRETCMRCGDFKPRTQFPMLGFPYCEECFLRLLDNEGRLSKGPPAGLRGRRLFALLLWLLGSAIFGLSLELIEVSDPLGFKIFLSSVMGLTVPAGYGMLYAIGLFNRHDQSWREHGLKELGLPHWRDSEDLSIDLVEFELRRRSSLMMAPRSPYLFALTRRSLVFLYPRGGECVIPFGVLRDVRVRRSWLNPFISYLAIKIDDDARESTGLTDGCCQAVFVEGWSFVGSRRKALLRARQILERMA